MRKPVLPAILVIACIPLAAQNPSRPIGQTRPFSSTHTPSYKDPNLKQQRIRTDRSTVSPEGRSSAVKTDQQLDKMERQTSQLVSQSTTKQKTYVPKYQAPPEKKTAGFEQTMPVHAQSTGLHTSSTSRRTNEPARAKSRYSR